MEIHSAVNSALNSVNKLSYLFNFSIFTGFHFYIYFVFYNFHFTQVR